MRHLLPRHDENQKTTKNTHRKVTVRLSVLHILFASEAGENSQHQGSGDSRNGGMVWEEVASMVSWPGRRWISLAIGMTGVWELGWHGMPGSG